MEALLEPKAQSVDAMVEVVTDMQSLALRALARMYRPEEGLFAFRAVPNPVASAPSRNGHRSADGATPSSGRTAWSPSSTGQAPYRLEGISRRYTAIALIGLADQPREIAAGIFQSESPGEVCRRLLAEVDNWNNLGDVALLLWACYALNQDGAERALRRLQALDPITGHHPTVEVSWVLTALVQDPQTQGAESSLSDQVAHRLMANFHGASHLFPHELDGQGKGFRSHVSCFADFVYPVQALSHYARRTQDAQATRIVRTCAERMCSLQGPAGQWWWHFDVRTGRVLERYPVYAVHQNSMAPMAFFALQDACGGSWTWPVEQGLRWLMRAPEIQNTLIDRKADFIWRKVARHEPGKLVRGLQAYASRLHPAIRFPGVDVLFPASWIDYESRPYHMGWILHAWSNDRISRFRRA